MNSIIIKHWCNTQFRNFCSPFDENRWKASQIAERILRVIAAAFGFLLAAIVKPIEKTFKNKQPKFIVPIHKKIDKIPLPGDSPLTEKPDELLDIIYSYLDPASLEVLSKTSQNLHGRIHQSPIWKEDYNKALNKLFCEHHFNHLPVIYFEERENNCILNYDSKTKILEKLPLESDELKYFKKYFKKAFPNNKKDLIARCVIKDKLNRNLNGFIVVLRGEKRKFFGSYFFYNYSEFSTGFGRMSSMLSMKQQYCLFDYNDQINGDMSFLREKLNIGKNECILCE